MERKKIGIKEHKEYRFIKDELIGKKVGLINKLKDGSGFVIRYGFKFYNDFYIEGDNHLLLSFNRLTYMKGEDGYMSIENKGGNLLWSNSFINEVSRGDEVDYKLREEEYKVMYGLDEEKVNSLFKSFIEGLGY